MPSLAPCRLCQQPPQQRGLDRSTAGRWPCGTLCLMSCVAFYALPFYHSDRGTRALDVYRAGGDAGNRTRVQDDRADVSSTGLEMRLSTASSSIAPVLGFFCALTTSGRPPLGAALAHAFAVGHVLVPITQRAFGT